MKKSDLQYGWIASIGSLLSIFLKASPALFLAVCACGILNSLFFVAETASMQVLLDGATGLAAGDVGLSAVVWCAVMFGIVKLFQQVVNGCSNYLAEYQDSFMRGKLQALIHEKCARVEPVQYERSAFLNDVEKASLGMRNCISLVSVSVLIATSSIPYIIFVSLFLYSVQPVLVLAVLLIFVPLLFNHLVTGRLYTKLEENVAPLRRSVNYYEDCICGKDYIKDTRMLGIYSFFRNLYVQAMKKMTGLDMRTQKRTCKRAVLSKSVTVTGYLAIIGLLISGVVHGEISIGSFAAVFYSLSTLMGLMEELIDRHIGSLTKEIGTIGNFFRFLKYSERKEEGLKFQGGDIVLEHVSFRYPNTDQLALKDISLCIKKNETIAVVGVNGSGKTTLAKLLLGLYSPSEGKITYEKSGGQQGAAEQNHISAVFQDYRKYPFTLKENVCISDTACEQSQEDIRLALQKSGIDYEKPAFPLGLDTVLSREFDGVDVSIGQWQRIAIARGYYRSHGMIVLDEPTAAIDPLEEEKLYQMFLDLSQNKTSVIVTHRLGAARMADRIFVFNQGILEESGTHEELMEKGGLYKTAFMAQAQWYYDRE